MTPQVNNDNAAQLQELYAEMRPNSLYPLWEVLSMLAAILSME